MNDKGFRQKTEEYKGNVKSMKELIRFAGWYKEEFPKEFRRLGCEMHIVRAE
jgi:hypothetical protein